MIYFFISRIYITIRICNIYTKVWRCLQSLQNHPNSSCKHHPYHTLSQNTHNPRGHWGASDIIVTSITTARRLSTTWQLTYKIAVPQNPWGKLGWGMKTPCPGGVVLGKVAHIGSWDIDLDIDIEYEHPLPFADITNFKPAQTHGILRRNLRCVLEPLNSGDSIMRDWSEGYSKIEELFVSCHSRTCCAYKTRGLAVQQWSSPNTCKNVDNVDECSVDCYTVFLFSFLCCFVLLLGGAQCHLPCH